MKLNYYSSHKNFQKETVEFIESIYSKKKGPVYIALSGGTTPEPIYKLLKASKKLAWDRIHLFIVDERYVPINDPASNYGMIAAALGKKVLTQIKNFSYFHTDYPLKKCIAKYKQDLKSIPGFDLVILGIGPDGHTASLFPKQTAINTRQTVVHTTTTVFKVKDRLSITFPIILKSKNILVLLNGQEKMSTLKELTEGKKTVTNFPAKRLLKHKNLTINFHSSTK